MPIHDVGYRAWAGRLMSSMTRWWVITEAGIKINLKNSWVRRTLLLAWLPVIAAGFFIFGAEKMLEVWNRDPDTAQEFLEFFEESSNAFHDFQPVKEALIAGDQNSARNSIWSWILLNFFRVPQGITVVLLLGLIVPPLVANDVRSRAFQLYYARPIGRLDYIIGKLGIPAFFIALITTVPSMGLYFFGVMMSPDLSVIQDTWQIPLQILLASVLLILPTCALALMFSSMTHESRFAGFAWFTVWGLGIVAWSMIFQVKASQLTEPARIETNWSLLSLYNTLHKAQSWIFGLETRFSYVAPSLILLLCITIFSLLILSRRVAAPLRA